MVILLIFILFLLSFGISVIGFTYIISYLNLLSMGYSLNDYFSFILRRSECQVGIIGFIVITIIIFMKGDTNDLHI